MSVQEAETTRRRLLEAAGEVFAAEGFRCATVREICRRAGANIAAVNYHFGDKQRLYVEVLKMAHQCAVENYPENLGLGEGATAEERLGAAVHSLLLRLLDEGRPAWQGKLMSREMAEPTGALEQIIEQSIRPQFERLRGVVRELMGERASEAAVVLCANSVVGQCLFYRHAQPVIQRIEPEMRFDAATIEQLAGHITGFSLAAMREGRMP